MTAAQHAAWSTLYCPFLASSEFVITVLLCVFSAYFKTHEGRGLVSVSWSLLDPLHSMGSGRVIME